MNGIKVGQVWRVCDRARWYFAEVVGFACDRVRIRELPVEPTFRTTETLALPSKFTTRGRRGYQYVEDIR